jgi:hypothetical protein
MQLAVAKATPRQRGPHAAFGAFMSCLSNMFSNLLDFGIYIIIFYQFNFWPTSSVPMPMAM